MVEAKHLKEVMQDQIGGIAQKLEVEAKSLLRKGGLRRQKATADLKNSTNSGLQYNCLTEG